MKTKLSNTRIQRIRAQGYRTQTEAELNDLAFGNRFAYRLCVSLLVPGVIFSSIPILTAMMIIAFFGVVLPNHPFDYIYNNVLARRLKKARLPKRSAQLKFACIIATFWIGLTISLFYSDMMLAGYITGGLLVVAASLAGFIDFCIPSIAYNAIFERKKETVYS